MSPLDIPTAAAFLPLLEPARYKGAHGGRGSGKSRFFAGLLVEYCIMHPGTHAVCIREVQKSLAQSAKRNIELTIAALGVGHLFDIQKAEIKTPGGGLIIFQGMQNHTAESIKSLEGYDVAWVEEAQTLSSTSLRLLRPTLRKGGSELWFSWNPRQPTDPVDALLRGNDPAEKNWSLPPRAVTVEANWRDNPWFDNDTELAEERDYDLRRDPEMYDHVWGGAYWSRSDAQVFRQQSARHPHGWTVEAFDRPADVALLGGADWGFTIDPTVLVLCYIVGKKLFVWREAWGTGCGPDKRPALFDSADPDWTPLKGAKSLARRVPIIADSALPEAIDSMKKAGFNIRAAVKGANSVEEGVSFLQGYDIVVHPSCENVIRELARYRYKVDPHTDTVLPVLEDKDNHTIDSLRYALEGVRRARSVGVEYFGG